MGISPGELQHGSDREFREQLKEKEASREILRERTFQQGSPLEVEPSEAEMERLRALGYGEQEIAELHRTPLKTTCSSPVC